MVDKESRTPFQPVAQSDKKLNTEQIPIIEPPNKVIYYSYPRHFKAFFKKLWHPKLFSLGLIGLIVTGLAALLAWQTTRLIDSVACVIAVTICFVYPTLRARYWWIHCYIEVTLQQGHAVITLYEPRSRLYGFKGDNEGISFTLIDPVAIKLNKKTWWELYIFRKSGGGLIDTPLQEDDALHELRDIYRPDLLRQAIEDAMEDAREERNI